MVPHIDNIITQFTTSGEWAGQADEGGICDPVEGGGGGGQMRRDIKERSHEDHNIMYYYFYNYYDDGICYRKQPRRKLD